MRDIKTWMWTAMFMWVFDSDRARLHRLMSRCSCVSCPSNGFGTFGGLITKGFGFDSFKASRQATVSLLYHQL